MSKASTNEFVPEIRFPEFRGHWIQKTLGESFEERSEKNRSDLPLLSLGENGLVYQSETARKDNSNADKSKYLRVAVGDIAYNTMRMWQGRCVCAGIEGIVSPAYTVCKPKEGVDSLFHYYLFKTQRMIQVFHQNSQGLVSDTLNLKYDSFSKIKYLIPPTLAEQEKIAQFLSEADEMISAQEQKVESLKAHKKGLMQQLFPQPGATTPALRFPGFTGKWQEKKLNKVFSRVTRKNAENNQNVLTISAQYGLISQLEFFKKSVASSDVTGYYLLHRGEFAYNKSSSQGRPVGAIKPLRLYDKGVVSTLYICFKCNNPEEIDFWEQYFDAGILDSEIFSIAQEGARNHGLLNISTGDFFGLNVILPTPPEMKKIAECLSSFDDVITAAENELDSLKSHKKGLMQQLFPQL